MPLVEAPYNKAHALVAPGQGNQEIGMGRELALRSEAAQQVWKESSTALYSYLGYDFSEFVWFGTKNGIPFAPDPEESRAIAEKELTKTENAQPAGIIDSLARRAAFEEFGHFEEPPYYYAGNSLGFLVALRNVGALSIPATVQLGIGRGEAFKYAVANSPKTTMLALVQIAPELVDETRTNFGLETCLINTDKQIVLGGPVDNVAEATRSLTDRLQSSRGIMPLNVDAAFHSKYMEAAVPLYRKTVESIDVQAPRFGVLIGASGHGKELHTPDEIREELVNQLIQTENWRSAMHYLVDEKGVTMITELNNIPRLTNMNIEMFGGPKRAQKIATPKNEEPGDTGVAIGQRWDAKAA